MAESAKSGAVSLALNGPNYSAALNIIRTDIEQAKSAQSKPSGNATAAWKKIESLGVNKQGAKVAASLLAIKDGSQEDAVRTVLKLLDLGGAIPRADLVDMAEDATRRASSGNGDDGAGDGDDDQDADQGGDDDGAGDGGAEADPEPERAPAAAETGGGAGILAGEQDRLKAEGGGFDDKGANRGFTASDEEWDSAAEADAARAKVGQRRASPVEARKARGRAKPAPGASPLH